MDRGSLASYSPWGRQKWTQLSDYHTRTQHTHSDTRHTAFLLPPHGFPPPVAPTAGVFALQIFGDRGFHVELGEGGMGLAPPSPTNAGACLCVCCLPVCDCVCAPV